MSGVRTVEVGYSGSLRTKVPRESLMLTDDENIIDVQMAVQYRLKDAPEYLFNNRYPDEAVKQSAETAIREIVGRSKMDFVLYEGREQVAIQAQQLTQQILDRYKTGILISSVTIQNAQPPEQVQAAFDDAVKAGQDRERAKNEGQAYANDVIPRARGNASRLLQEADGYKQRVIAKAEGDASRFGQVVAEYAKAPAVTRQRMYIDTMQEIYSNAVKVMVDARTRQQPADAAARQAAAAGRAGRARASAAQQPNVSSASPTAPTPGVISSAGQTTGPSDVDPRSRDGDAQPRPGRPMINRIIVVVLGVLIALMILSSTFYVVDQRRYAILFALRRDQGRDPRAGPALQAAAAVPERRVPRQAHPDDRHARGRALHHVREAQRAGRHVRQVAHRRPEAVLHQHRRRHGPCGDPHGADHQGGAERGDHQAHDARGGVGRARTGDGGDQAEGRRRGEADRRRDRRRALEAGRPAARDQRVDLQPHGSRASSRGQRAALDRRRRVREDPRRRRPPEGSDPRRGVSRRREAPRARAMPGRRRSTRRRSAPTPSSMPSIAASTPTGRASAARATCSSSIRRPSSSSTCRVPKARPRPRPAGSADPPGRQPTWARRSSSRSGWC